MESKVNIINILKNIRNKYVISQVERANIPEFKQDKTVRYHMNFSGRVQRVGFRLEVEELAKRLELTGWIQNLDNGNVKMEIQGMDNKIKFLTKFMKSLIRIKIRSVKKEKIPVLTQEEGFIKL